MIEARPYGDKKKSADTGIDGYIYFWDSNDEIKNVIIQVKSGKVGVKDIRELDSVVKRENAAMGIFITLEQPSKGMISEAASCGFYQSNINKKNYPKIQILTISEIFEGVLPNLPRDFQISPFKNARFKNIIKQNNIFH